MKILKINLVEPDDRVIAEAVGVLERGGLIIYPTDTAYGLGGNALDPEVVRKVFRTKGRGERKPIHVVVQNFPSAGELVYLNDWGRTLAARFLPGPLTLIFRKKKIVPGVLVGGGAGLGIRIPKNSITQKISELVIFPYTATSANPSGGATPYSLDEAMSQFSKEALKMIDLILDVGTLPRVLPSTVVDLSGSKPILLREGPIPRKAVEKVLGVIVI